MLDMSTLLKLTDPVFDKFKIPTIESQLRIVQAQLLFLQSQSDILSNLSNTTVLESMAITQLCNDCKTQCTVLRDIESHLMLLLSQI